MTLYVIDQSRPLPRTSNDYDHALDLTNGDTVILSDGAPIEALGFGAYGIYGGTNTTLLIDGSVFSQSATAISTHGTINIGTQGSVWGEWSGVTLLRDDAGGNANLLNNSGLIWGFSAGISIKSAQAVITNSGTITGVYVGISGPDFYGWDQKLVINNTGMIEGTDGAIFGTESGQTIISNQGHIEGLISLGRGNDLYDGRGGTINGEILLGWGNDIAFGGDGSETFYADRGHNFIDGGGGIDTLKFSQDSYQSGVSITVDLRITEEQQVNSTGYIAWNTIRNIENLIGNAIDDRFTGNDVANVFVGAAGADTLDGQGGNDILNGGTGSDVLIGGEGSDIAVFSGKFSDYIIGGAIDGLITIMDKRVDGDGFDQVSGVEFALFSDMLYTLPTGPVPSPTPTTPSTPTQTPTTQPSTPPLPQPVTNQKFTGGKKADAFTGGKGHDYLNGGLGRDQLTGGEGQDTFAFTSKIGRGNVDRILDFTSAEDTIQLSKAIFGKLKKGVLSSEAFHIGSKTQDKGHHIIYKVETGELFYDRDGSGRKYGAVKFATLNANTALSADDFLVM